MATTKNTDTYKDEPDPTHAESEMTEAIAKDRPTIDSAVKSFISMICARSMASSDRDAAHDKVVMGIIPSLAKSSLSESNSDKDTGTVDTNLVSSANNNSNKSKPPPNKSVQVLELARYILKAVNSYTFPIHDTAAYSKSEKPGISKEKKEELLEMSVVARLWNALVQSEQKPSRFLGRRALKLAWKDLDIVSLIPSVENGVGNENLGNGDAMVTAKSDNSTENPNQTHGSRENEPKQQHHDIEVRERQLEWLQQFERLLFDSFKPLPSDMRLDDDSALLWATDGGAAELAKRRQRRLDAAKERGPSTPS